MADKRVFVTGASGCLGHYLAEMLVEETTHEVFFLVRDPDRFHVETDQRPGITVIQGDLHDIGQWRQLLKTIDVAILAAAAWGGTQETFDINVAKPIQLLKMLDPEICHQVIYFSTASILDHHHQPLKAAAQLGTDYIRSKYTCLQELTKLAIAQRTTVLFPTLIFGGDDQKPYSHLSAGLPDTIKWINLLRFFQMTGSFHFIHAQDVAQVVRHLIHYPASTPQFEQLVLGNARITVNEAIADICAHLGKRIWFRLRLYHSLINLFILLFQIQMAAWDRFCLKQRHLTYENPVSPATFGLTPYCPTVADLLRVSGIPGKGNH